MRRSVWIVILSVSILANISGILLWSARTASGSLEAEETSKDLTGTLINHASITYSGINAFFSSILRSERPLQDNLYVFIPPFSCPQCVASSLLQLARQDTPFVLLTPSKRADEMLIPGSPSVDIRNYEEPDNENLVCYYPDLVFVEIKDGRIGDYYLHNKDVPEAMEIFIQNHSPQCDMLNKAPRLK